MGGLGGQGGFGVVMSSCDAEVDGNSREVGSIQTVGVVPC